MKKGQFTALLTALLMTAACTACGRDGGSAGTDPAQGSSAAADESTADSGDERSAESSEDESGADSGSSKSGEKSSSSQSDDSKSGGKSDSSKAESSKSDSSMAAEESGAADSKSGSDANSGSGNAGSSGDSGSPAGNAGSPSAEAGNSGDTGNSGNTGNPDNSGSTGNSGESGNAGSGEQGAAGEDDLDTEDAEKPTKYIYLQDTTAQYSGDGITVSGGTVTISKGGTYEISGTLSNGQIYIMTDKKKVKLHLNGADITNHAGAAINCQNAKKVTITTLAGTVNYLEDGGTHDADKGTVFSEDTVVLNGEGELNIKANYAHGIQSDDDIIVNGGTVNITSAKSALHSNDGIEINGGVLLCDGGTNGIKTDGYITVTGGSSIFLGGTREEKGAVYCDGAFTVTGGNFWAIGNTCTTPDASLTTANVIGMMFNNSQSAGTIVNVTSGANNIFTMTSPRNFKYVVYAGPNLLTGAEYNVSYGGTADGEQNYVYSGAYSGGTDGGSFTAGNTVTFYTVS